MLKAPKTFAGLMIKKIAALVVGYSFLATSVWSLNPPGSAVRSGSSARWMSLGALRSPIDDPLSRAGANYGAVKSGFHPVGPRAFANFAALNGTRPWLDDSLPANCTIHSSQPSGDDGENDDQRRDEHRSYQHHDYKYGSDDAPQGPNPPITPSGVAIFGQTYTRTTGPTDDFTSTITVPAWASQPFFLHVVNGDAAGDHRVSSATVAINGTTLISESVFNQHIASIDCAVQLTVSSTLQVDLDSKPGSFLTITALAKSLDHTPPVVTIVSPGAAVNTSQPLLDIRYQDPVGAGETVASGVNTTTLRVLLDGVDRTSLFTRFANEATADLPASLALSPGTHTITASIQDNAENLGQATEQFQVNTARPVIQILQPVAGTFLNSATPQVALAYSGSIALNLASLKVTDNGVDITSSLTVTATGASGTAPSLAQGGNTIVASISDQAGNQATASVTFNVDTTAPIINIVHPVQGSIHGTNSIDYLIQYSDDQAIDPSSLAVTLDGAPLGVAAGAASVSGTVTLNNGTSHVLTASIKDKAGNPATTSSTFTVDTTVPNIHIIAPANNSALNNPEPQFQVTYDESISGVDTHSFKASVDGGDLTSLFNLGASSASATLQTPLADGSHTFAAQIASTAGNVGQTSNQVLIDTIKPQLTIVSPAGPVSTTTPTALAQYSDSGSGIDLSSVHVTLDNADITATLGVSTSAASGNLGAGSGLSETTHQFAVSVADKAGNVAQASSSFLVDVTPPTAAFSNPVDGSFINNPLPVITLAYSDPGSGSGVDLNSIHVFLAQGTASETEITSLFTFGAAQGTAPIPASSPLAPGTYHLRAALADKAGNPAKPAANFVLDTTPPTYTIVTPPANAFLNTATPAFTVNYQDDLSQVDTTKFALFVDGVDRTSSMTLTANGASGTLQAALADGPHQVSVNVFDLAGNQAPVVPQPFLVDTTPPTISITAPAAGGFTNSNRTSISITYLDNGSGIDITSFQLLVDNVDHTADLTRTATGATGSLSTALLDGSHSIVANIKDLAANPATATTTYTVDTVPPQIVITQPADGSFTNAASATVLGTVISAAPVVSLTINGVSTPLSGNSFTSAPVTLGADGSSTTITALATDAAGNSGQQTVRVNVDRTPPQIVFTQPADGSFTNATSIIATGTVTGAAPVVSVTVNGIGASLSGNSFTSAAIQLGADGSSTTITAIATDTAGNTSAPKTVTVNVDRAAPQVIINQPVDGSFTNANSVTVSGSVTSTDSVASVTVNGVNASLSGNSFTSAPVQLGADGSSTTITVIAKDAAGNSSSPKTLTVTVDRTPPVVVFTQPGDGSFTNATSVIATGTVTSIAPVTSLTINGVKTPLSGNSFTSAPISLGADGSSTAITASAIDAAGNVTTKTVTVTVDRTQPTITLATPDTITPLHPGQITATVQDVVPVSQVVISVNNIPLATLTSSPFQVTLPVPTGSNPGDTLTVTGTVTDVAGNTALATPHSVRVAADGGVIVGQVLDDLTGLPLAGASVQIIAATTSPIPTDSQGRYSLQASSNHIFLSVNVPPSPPGTTGTTTIEREVVVQPGVGTVPVDARLTTLPQGVGIGSSGGTLSAGTISISVASGSVPDGTKFQLTSLSGQGLPNLLPLGWSFVAAFDLRASASPASLNATIAQVPNAVANLVVYSTALHAWTMVSPSLPAVSGSLTFPVPGVGTYSLVVPDTTTPPIPVPAAGGALTGITVQALDPAVTGAISLNPPVLPAGGGTSTATVNLQAPTLSPSGTVVQANVSETFSLASGDKVSEETRSEDVVLYNALAATTPAMMAQVPLTPSHTYTNAQLVSGNVHLDILSGREGVRGKPGGNDPVTVTDGIATLSVPGGALGVDTAIAVQSTSLETFVPTSSTFGAIQEVVVDFSGETLNTPAQLSISSTGLNPADTFLLTQVVRINGVPHMVAAAVGQVSNGTLTSVASPGLPGVVQGGEYVFYDISSTSGVGFVTGITKTSAGLIQALVQTDSLPIVSISGLHDGRYIVPALAGTVNLKANGTASSVAGTASTPLTAGQLATVDILLNGVVNAANVSPADTSLGVSISTIITITSPVPVNPSTILPPNLVLFQGTPAVPGAPVPLLQNPPFILSASGTVLTFAPAQNLNPATQYTIQVAGLADMGGGAIVVPTSSFTTKANQPLAFDPNAIAFAFPDANGNIHVSAPAGSLPLGTKVLIVDQSNAVVLSLTAFNDGSVSGDFPGTINDLLQVTVTDPSGATTTFTRSQFVAADGSVAVGPGGGTVTGAGGVALMIPAGALDKGATFKIEAFGADLFPERPDVPGGTFGAGLKISSPDNPTFKKEAKVAFPMPPGAPPGAFFQVYSRLQTPDNSHVIFADVDYALPQGQGPTAQVVTASFPYRGLIDLNMLIAQADFNGQAIDTAFSVPPLAQLGEQAVMYLIWTANDILPGISLGGAVTGRVRYAVFPGGAMPDGTINSTGSTVFVGVLNALVTVDDNPPSHAVIGGTTGARTQPDGSFTFSDPHYHGGPVNVIAHDGNGNAVTFSAIEVAHLTDKVANDYAGPLLRFYRNVAFADIVVPAPAPPPPTPQIGISLFTEDPNSQPRPGLRKPASAILTTGQQYVVAFKTNGQFQLQGFNATINGVSYDTQPDAPKFDIQSDTINTDPNKLDFELSQYFIPSTPGIYTISATGLTAFAQPITVSRSFLVVAPGGSNNQILPGVPPEIAAVTPAGGATGVPVDTFVQVTFSEPVTNLAGNVSLIPADGSAPPPVRLSGFSYLDVANMNPIANLSATDAVSTLTIQPLTGLKFNTQYTVQITSAVVDLDNVADPTKPALHLKQPPTPYTFTTFGPQVLGGTAAFSSTRPVVLGDRAYVAMPNVTSEVKTFDISDPTNPTEVPASFTSFIGRAFDIAGEENAPVIGGSNLIAVVAGFASENITVPSNMWLYNVSGDQMTRVGAVSVTSSVNTGQGVRLALHGNFAYTYVNPSGIEVVDLQQAVSDYTSTFASNPTQFGVAVTTEGQGFATDAVVNTIPVQDSTGRNVTLWGIQAGDFLVPGSGSANPTTQTFAVATGGAPTSTSPTPISFVVADPTQPGPSALVYSGQPQLGKSKLTNGMALALGQLIDSIPDASGNPVVKPVAVAVGYGVAPDPADPTGTKTTFNVLAVMDMTTPSAPVPLSVIGLPAAPTDVVLKDTTALVGTSLNEVLLINLVDPRNPVNAGVIAHPGSVFGDKLAITDAGFLLGASMNAANGGIQTATFKPFLGLSLTPILARLIPSTIQAQANTDPPLLASLKPMVPLRAMLQAQPSAAYETVADTQVNAQVFLAQPTGNGAFLLDRTACGMPPVQLPLAFSNTSANPISTVTLPKGTAFCATTIPVSASVNTNKGPLRNSKDKSATTMEVIVDANNNTLIDDTDEKVRHQQAFQFWQQDPLYRVQTNQSDFQSGNPLNATKGLADYASVRIKVNNGSFVGTGIVSLKMDDGPGTSPVQWSLVEKSGQGNLYLTDETTSNNQINNILTGIPICSPFHNQLTGECLSAAGKIELPSLSASRDFLFTCVTCPTNPNRRLVLIYENPPFVPPTELDYAKVDIRPLGELISIRSARQQLVGGQPSPLFKSVQGWLTTPSSDAAHITVFVHGFDNTEAAVISDNIPTYAKRLYWSKHKILQAQKGGFVGVSWPSNPGIPKFPQGELLGLETGVPFACLLKELKAGNQPTLNIVAHSLGNMVVNSALQRIGSGIVDNYVMNEAALPGEAFHDPATPFAPGETNPSYTDKVQRRYGYPTDNDWFSRTGAWLDMVAGKPTDFFGNPDLTDFNRWNNSVSTLPDPKPFYYERWTQVRPATGVPDSAPQDFHSHRGPWKGYFFGNRAKISGNFLNMTSVVDVILGAPLIGTGAWDFMQRNQKPTVGFLGLATGTFFPVPTLLTGDINDERQLQFWATLGSTPANDEAVWNGGCDSPQPNHFNTVRQWEELAFWFESLSIAAGNGPVANAVNMDFTALSQSLTPGITHSYMTEKPFYQVKDGFTQIKNFLEGPL